jgi:hypothetical protein
MSITMLYGIMVLGAITMIVGLVKDKAGAAWGRQVAIAGIVVVLLAVILIGVRKMGGGAATQQVVDREVAFQKIGGKKLGTYLASKHAGAKVLILSEPKMGAVTGRTNPLIDGLKEAITGKLTVVAEVSPEVPADKAKAFAAEMPMEGGPAGGETPGQMMPPLEYWYTAKIFDDLIAKQSGFDLIVTTIGLPQDAGKSRILKDKNRPKIAVLNGTIYDLKSAINPDTIVAAITYNPKAVYDDKPVPKDLDEAFGKRFLIVTPDTLQQVSQAHPDIFRSGN